MQVLAVAMAEERAAMAKFYTAEKRREEGHTVHNCCSALLTGRKKDLMPRTGLGPNPVDVDKVLGS